MIDPPDNTQIQLKRILHRMPGNVRIAPFVDGYKYFRMWLEDAPKEILNLSYYHINRTFYPQDSKQIDTELQDARFKLRKTIHKVIEQEKEKRNSDLRYIRFLQIPDVSDRIPSPDEIQLFLKQQQAIRGKDFDAVEKMIDSRIATRDRFQFRVCRRIFHGTIVLVDGKKLAIDFQFWRSMTSEEPGDFRVPFTLIAEAETGENFKALRELFLNYILDISVSVQQMPE